MIEYYLRIFDEDVDRDHPFEKIVDNEFIFYYNVDNGDPNVSGWYKYIIRPDELNDYLTTIRDLPTATEIDLLLYGITE